MDTSFGCRIETRSQISRVDQFAGRAAGKRKKFGGLRSPTVIVPVLSRISVCTSPAASTAFPDMASTLKRTVRSMPAMPIADNKRADGGGNQRDEQRYQIRDIDPRLQINRDRRHRADHDQENQRQDREQRGERDLVRRLLAFRAFDQMDHAIEEALAGIRRHPHDQPIRDQQSFPP